MKDLFSGKLVRWFIAWFIGIMAILLITAPEQPPVRQQAVTFRMTEQDELYFKNLRLYYYRETNSKDKRFKALELKTYSELEEESTLKWRILLHTNADEAYIFPYFNSTPDSSASVWFKSNNQTRELTLFPNDAESLQQIALELNNALNETEAFFLKVDGNQTELSQDETDALATTLKDYFKLVGMR